MRHPDPQPVGRSCSPCPRPRPLEPLPREQSQRESRARSNQAPAGAGHLRAELPPESLRGGVLFPAAPAPQRHARHRRGEHRRHRCRREEEGGRVDQPALRRRQEALHRAHPGRRCLEIASDRACGAGARSPAPDSLFPYSPSSPARPEIPRPVASPL